MPFVALHERPRMLLLISAMAVSGAALLAGVQALAAPEYPIEVEVRDSEPLPEERYEYHHAQKGGTEFRPSDFEEREPVDWHQYAIDEEHERQQIAGEDAIEDEYRRGIFPGDCMLVNDPWWRRKCEASRQPQEVRMTFAPPVDEDQSEESGEDWVPDRTPRNQYSGADGSYSEPESFGLLGGRTGRCTGFLREPRDDDGAYFCGKDAGWTFPVLFGGDCPITLCMVKYGGGDGISGIRE